MAPLGAQKSTKTPLALTPGRKKRNFDPASNQEAIEDQIEQHNEGYPVEQHCEGDPVEQHCEGDPVERHCEDQ
eukprot:2524423-Lingulodinium_polyedra.AAC.1